MRKKKIFTFISRMFESKTTEELASIKSGLSLIYAFCATNAVFYFIYLTTKETYPTDPEKLKQWVTKKGSNNVPQFEVIKMTGLRKMEVTNDEAVNNTELLDNK